MKSLIYFESNIPWFNLIPVNFKITSIKNIFNIGRGRVISQEELLEDGQFPVYSSQTTNNGCLGYISTYDFDREQLTWTTDGANAGTIFLRKGKHNCTNVCGTLWLKETEPYDIRYLKHVLDYTTFYHKRSDTNGYKIMNNEMARIQVIVPPKEIQTKIAFFLDNKCAIIDSEIDKNKKFIELMQEYRSQSIIEKTRIGNKTRLKYLFNVIGSGTTPDSNNLQYYSGDVNWIQSGDINGGIIKKVTKCISNLSIEKNTALKIYQSPFIVIAMYGASIGNSSISMIDACTNQACCVLKDTRDNLNYIFYSIKKLKFVWESEAVGGTQPNINREKIRNSEIFVPPMEKQQEIVNYLDNKCSLIDKIIEYRKKLIEKLEEYKKSLIYEAVTGKLEV